MTAPVLLVGAGGIGAPAALALARAGLGALAVVDDDRVEATNLHRQILFGDADVGRPKIEAFADALRRIAPATSVETIEGRALPHTVASLVGGRRVVIDATDNFASRFLIADACALSGVAVVHAAAVRWQATVLAVAAGGRPCYRCVFEAPPEGDAPDCATAGVAGPVCGVAGAIAADRALGLLGGEPQSPELVTYDGLRDRLRAVPLRRRLDCALCGETPELTTFDPDRYEPAAADCTARPSAGDPAWRPPSESPLRSAP